MRNLYFYTLVFGVVLGAVLAPFLSSVTVLPLAIWLGFIGVVLLVLGYRGGGVAAPPPALASLSPALLLSVFLDARSGRG